MVYFGSPPHAWGILPLQVRHKRVGRFTPTRVGNTRKCVTSPRATTVHPHTRGEYAIEPTAALREHGSPPHAWGILRRRVSWGVSRRFTPTRVGNTPLMRITRCQAPVHPHTRGEYRGPPKCHRPRQLVHPHTRGEYALIPSITRIVHRFTPTRVGNTLRAIREFAAVGRFTPTRVGNTVSVGGPFAL